MATSDSEVAGAADGWLRVAHIDDVSPGNIRAVQTDHERVVLANVDGVVYALEDQCSHQDFPLSAGELDGTQIECPFHGAKFDVCTGRALTLPAVRPVRAFEVKVEDGEILLKLG